MLVKLSGDEILIKTLDAEKDWYVVRQDRTFKWSKTMFRRELLQKLILTTQHIIFLRENEIDSVIPVEAISRAVYDRARIGDSYLQLTLKNGDAIAIIFRHVGIQSHMGILRLATQTQITQDWIIAINDLIKRKEFP